eukprot:357838-Chlamydomonas_euryale.AAC.9
MAFTLSNRILRRRMLSLRRAVPASAKSVSGTSRRGLTTVVCASAACCEWVSRAEVCMRARAWVCPRCFCYALVSCAWVVMLAHGLNRVGRRPYV